MTSVRSVVVKRIQCAFAVAIIAVVPAVVDLRSGERAEASVASSVPFGTFALSGAAAWEFRLPMDVQVLQVSHMRGGVTQTRYQQIVRGGARVRGTVHRSVEPGSRAAGGDRCLLPGTAGLEHRRAICRRGAAGRPSPDRVSRKLDHEVVVVPHGPPRIRGRHDPRRLPPVAVGRRRDRSRSNFAGQGSVRRWNRCQGRHQDLHDHRGRSWVRARVARWAGARPTTQGTSSSCPAP